MSVINSSICFCFQWNIADFFYQNRQRIHADLDKDMTDTEKHKLGMPSFDALWMCLFMKLGQLCVDERPAVRKSAGQTLFSTISAHGGLLHRDTWKRVLWQVLDQSCTADIHRQIYIPTNLLEASYLYQFPAGLGKVEASCSSKYKLQVVAPTELSAEGMLNIPKNRSFPTNRISGIMD